MGKEAYEMQFKPVLVGKFGEFYDQIAMPWFWSRVHERSLSLGYLSGGFQQMYDRLGEEIEKAGGRDQAGHGGHADRADWRGEDAGRDRQGRAIRVQFGGFHATHQAIFEAGGGAAGGLPQAI